MLTIIIHPPVACPSHTHFRGSPKAMILPIHPYTSRLSSCFAQGKGKLSIHSQTLEFYARFQDQVPPLPYPPFTPKDYLKNENNFKWKKFLEKRKKKEKNL